MLTLTQGEAENYNKADLIEESTDENIETLRWILAEKHHLAFSYEEAAEVGQSLIAFFETLAQPKESENEQ